MSRRILVIRRDNIGDMVLTTPLLAALRARLPEATIDVLTNSYAAPVLAGNADVDAVHFYTKSHHRNTGESRLGVYLGRARTVFALRARRYDSIVLAKLPAEPRPLAFARVIGADEVIGLVKPDDAPPHGLTHAIRWHPAHRTHMVEALMQLGGHFGIDVPGGPTTVHPQSEARAEVLGRLAPVLARGTPLVALNLSARKIRQRWPVEHFVALAHSLHERHGCSFMLVWSPGAADNPRHPGDDAKAAEVLAGLAGLPVTALRTVHLVELIAGLSLAHAMISADGGAMHLGAACGLPVVALFGNSEPALWHPWRVPHEVLQHPARDVSMISVAEVVEAWERLAAHAAQRAGARSQSRVRSEREGAPRGRLVASR